MRRLNADRAQPVDPPAESVHVLGSGRGRLWNSAPDVGLLVLRLSIGGMTLSWGLPKVVNFSLWAPGYSDPLGIGSTVSLGATVVTQVPCAAFIMLGFFTRLSSLPPLVVMLVAAFLVHANSPWPAVEHALLYAAPLATLSLTGAGRFSVDRWLFGSNRRGFPRGSAGLSQRLPQ